MRKTHKGSCHCGAVSFEVDIDLAQGTFRCNCSFCFKTRAWFAFVPARDFRLLTGAELLADYQFGPGRLHHRFCSRCGVRTFAEGRDPQGNEMRAPRVTCLDGVSPQELIDAPVRYFNMLQDDVSSPPAETRHL